jgi:DNA-binding beta-propeller fold protein YncE
MKSRIVWLVAAILWLTRQGLPAQDIARMEASRVHLPNGWSLTPAGKSLPLGDLPLNIAVSSSGKYLAVTNNGQSDQTLSLIDGINDLLLDTLVVGKAWFGLAFSRDEKHLYASGGNDNWILVLSVEKGKLVPKDTLRLGKPWPEKISPAGIALDESAGLLYTVTKENNSLYIFDLRKKEVAGRYELGGEGYTCLLSPDARTLFISCWGCDRLLFFDTKSRSFTGNVSLGDNPNDMCLSRDGKSLYVACSNDNSVWVMDLKSRAVVETLNAALYPNAPPGSTSNSVAVSADGKTLYIANADNNCLAVFDISLPANSKSRGFIPAGWYPTAVRAVKGKIYVANGKGLTSHANPLGPNPMKRHEKVVHEHADPSKPEVVQYIGGLFRGTLSIIPEPGEKLLADYSRLVYDNTPYTKDRELAATGQPGNPIPMKVGDISPVKYVFYIIKENRTYDQVLGDMPKGNGDTSLVLFGKKVTPNQHKLAADFVLLDNFYVDAEVSADGHNWSMGGYATDYLEKTWPTSYGGRGGGYDAEGGREIANNKNGFIWDFCKRYDVTYRTYGEFADDYKPNLPVLKDHFCPYYTSWDQSVFDTTRFYQWKRDFDSLLAKNAVPEFNTLRLINDHTEGLRLGRRSPVAEVADNDRAVGLLVEYLSKSPIWKETAIFILEDDAQNGADHVDAHRSPVYLAGGFVKRRFVDHTLYSTTSVLRTIELILGLPPMSQYDAAAMPMWRCFSNTPDTMPFHAVPPQVDLYEKNTAMNRWQKASEDFDFSREDRADDDMFNQVLWYAIKGDNVPVSPAKRAAFVRVSDD